MVQQTPSAPPVIEILGLSKIFKDFWMRPRVRAVSQVDLSVLPHEVFGLLGPNGSGKSTTIKIILGLLFPSQGRVAVFGRLPNDVAIKRRIGYLPEETYLYRFLNARETLDYYGRIFGLDRRQRQKRIDMLLEMVGLDAVQHRPVGEYSKGMQRRIGLAQALINDPDLLILDEPTTGMDPIGTRQIKDLILELKTRGKTVLLSSHLLADVEDVCDRVSILYGGKVRAQGTVDELLKVSDSTVIETASLRPETVTKIDALLSQEEGKAIRKVDAPRQKLETLFLQIVHQAQSEGALTAGARLGGPVAEFLAAEKAEGASLIDQLVRPASAPAAPSESPAPRATVSEPAEKSLIDTLTQSAPAPSGPAVSAPQEEKTSPPPAAPSPQADQGLIDDLLKGGGA